MKVKYLRAVLAGADDDDEVLVPSSDHSYRSSVTVHLIQVNRGKSRERGEWWEFWGEDSQNDELESDVVVAVVIE